MLYRNYQKFFPEVGPLFIENNDYVILLKSIIMSRKLESIT